jgi:hypothetical protein
VRAGANESANKVLALSVGDAVGLFSVCFLAMTTSQVPGRETHESFGVSGSEGASTVIRGTCPGKIESVLCSSVTNSTVLCIPTSQWVFGRRYEKTQERSLGFRFGEPWSRFRAVRTVGSVVLDERRASRPCSAFDRLPSDVGDASRLARRRPA